MRKWRRRKFTFTEGVEEKERKGEREMLEELYSERRDNGKGECMGRRREN